MDFIDTGFESFPFGAVFAAVAAFASFRIVAAQSRGEPIRLWRLSVAPVFAMLSATALFIKASLSTPCLTAWFIILTVGFVVGAVAGRSARLHVDYVYRLVRVQWGFESVLAAVVILFAALAGIVFSIGDFTVLEWTCIAAMAAGLCAGLLGGRAWWFLKAAFQSPETRLSDR